MTNRNIEGARSSMDALILNESCSDRVLIPQYLATAPFVKKNGDSETLAALAAFESRHVRLLSVTA